MLISEYNPFKIYVKIQNRGFIILDQFNNEIFKDSSNFFIQKH